MVKDPVCGMTVDDNSSHKSTQAGQTYLFCGDACKAKFDKEPARYKTPDGVLAQPGAHKQGCC